MRDSTRQQVSNNKNTPSFRSLDLDRRETSSLEVAISLFEIGNEVISEIIPHPGLVFWDHSDKFHIITHGEDMS